jgi:hypothetical protein
MRDPEFVLLTSLKFHVSDNNNMAAALNLFSSQFDGDKQGTIAAKRVKF